MMTANMLDLGIIELDDPDLQMSLRISSTAHFAQPEEGVSDPAARLIADTYQDGTIGGFWTDKAQNFRLVIDLRAIEDALFYEQIESLTQLVAGKLAKAKMWSALSLAVSAMEVTPVPATRSYQLSVSLSHQLHLRSAGDTSRLLHAIDRDVPYYDIKPPPTVASRQIDVVSLCMTVCGLPGGRANYAGATQVVCAKIDSCPCNCCCNTAPALGSAGSQNTLSDELIWIHGDDDESCPEPQGDECLLETNDELCWLEETWMSESILDSPANTSIAFYPTPPSSQQIGLQSTKGGPRTVPTKVNKGQTQLDCKAVLPMIEAGLRLTIVDAPTRLPTAVRVRTRNALRPLAQVMPSLWIPKYHQNLSRRIVLIPTISHALASVAQSISTNKDLSAKVNEIARRGAFSRSIDHIDDTDARRDLSALSDSLWHMAASSLYDTTAARRLRPLASQRQGVTHKNEHEADDCDRLDILLDNDYSLQSLAAEPRSFQFGFDSDDESATSSGDVLSDLDNSDSESMLSDLQEEAYDTDQYSVMSSLDPGFAMDGNDAPSEHTLSHGGQEFGDV